MEEADPIYSQVHMQKCLTADENPAAITKADGSVDPYFNVLSDYKGQSIKDLCLDNASKDEGSICVGSFKNIARAAV